jgi:hypothetical protein
MKRQGQPPLSAGRIATTMTLEEAFARAGRGMSSRMCIDQYKVRLQNRRQYHDRRIEMVPSERAEALSDVQFAAEVDAVRAAHMLDVDTMRLWLDEVPAAVMAAFGTAAINGVPVASHMLAAVAQGTWRRSMQDLVLQKLARETPATRLRVWELALAHPWAEQWDAQGGDIRDPQAWLAERARADRRLVQAPAAARGRAAARATPATSSTATVDLTDTTDEESGARSRSGSQSSGSSGASDSTFGVQRSPPVGHARAGPSEVLDLADSDTDADDDTDNQVAAAADDGPSAGADRDVPAFDFGRGAWVCGGVQVTNREPPSAAQAAARLGRQRLHEYQAATHSFFLVPLLLLAGKVRLSHACDRQMCADWVFMNGWQRAYDLINRVSRHLRRRLDALRVAHVADVAGRAAWQGGCLYIQANVQEHLVDMDDEVLASAKDEVQVRANEAEGLLRGAAARGTKRAGAGADAGADDDADDAGDDGADDRRDINPARHKRGPRTDADSDADSAATDSAAGGASVGTSAPAADAAIEAVTSARTPLGAAQALEQLGGHLSRRTLVRLLASPRYAGADTSPAPRATLALDARDMWPHVWSVVEARLGPVGAAEAVLSHAWHSPAWVPIAHMPLTHLCLLLRQAHRALSMEESRAAARDSLQGWLRGVLGAGEPSMLLGLLQTIARCPGMAAVCEDVDPEQLLRSAVHVRGASGEDRLAWRCAVANEARLLPAHSVLGTAMAAVRPPREYADADADRVMAAVLSLFPPRPWTGMTIKAAFTDRVDTLERLFGRRGYPPGAPYRRALLGVLARTAAVPDATRALQEAAAVWRDPDLEAVVAGHEAIPPALNFGAARG